MTNEELNILIACVKSKVCGIEFTGKLYFATSFNQLLGITSEYGIPTSEMTDLKKDLIPGEVMCSHGFSNNIYIICTGNDGYVVAIEDTASCIKNRLQQLKADRYTGPKKPNPRGSDTTVVFLPDGTTEVHQDPTMVCVPVCYDPASFEICVFESNGFDYYYRVENGVMTTHAAFPVEKEQN